MIAMHSLRAISRTNCAISVHSIECYNFRLLVWESVYQIMPKSICYTVSILADKFTLFHFPCAFSLCIVYCIAMENARNRE